MSLQNVGFGAFFCNSCVSIGNQDWCLVRPKIFLLKTTLTGFNSSTCFTDIANVVWQWYIFQHQQHFPKKHFQFVEAGQRGRYHPSKVTMMLVLVIIMRIIHVDIGIMEFMKFMKYWRNCSFLTFESLFMEKSSSLLESRLNCSEAVEGVVLFD